MSNRRRISRTRRTSYANRLQRRPRAPRGRPPAGWLPATVAAVAIAGEAGHLASAYVEWPQSTARGTYHVLVGALLGVIAAGAFTRAAGSWWVAGAAAALAGPALWLGGTLLDVSTYRQVPAPVAAATVVTELTLAIVLAATWRIAHHRVRAG